MTDGPSQQPIAIIGLGLRLPGADGLEGFWDVLAAKKSLIRELPRERWSRDEAPQDGVWGGFLDGADRFDADFFSISPREAAWMDPQQRFALEMAWHAIEDAGYPASALAGSRAGVFLGVCHWDYAELLEKRLSHVDAYTPTGIAFSIIANRVSHFFDFRGPSVVNDTACAASLTAVHEAVRSLQSGECDMALAGGVNLIWSPNHFTAFAKAGMLSKSGQAKVFDDKADGYVRGEGGAVLLLKPLARALADEDPIHAVISASGVNHGGRTNSLTVTSPDAQADLIADVMRRAGASPDGVDYIEAHGTGTPLGDPIEIAGLKKAYAALYEESKLSPQAEACGIGSVKTNIGHLEGAAGVAGIVKILAALGHETLPANAGFERLNRLIDLAGTPFRIQSEATPWPQRAERPRRAAVSSFGFGGSNAHLLIEEAPPTPDRRPPTPKRLLFPLSAKTEERLQAQAANLLAFAERHPPNVEPADLAYTLQTGREAMQVRLAVAASDWRDLAEALRAVLDGREDALRTDHREDAIAADWVAGKDVDWKSLWASDDRPKRIHAPLYAFARQRHWMDVSLGAKDLGSAPHPLLHRNLSTLSGVRFCTRLKGGEYFWAEHHVGGRQVLPGVVMLEMVRAGMDFAEDGKGGGLVLENLVWPRPVRADGDGAALELALAPKDGGLVAFEVRDAEDASRVFCQGAANRRIAPVAKPVDLEALRQTMPNEIAPSDCYAKLRASGVAHGPAFQALAQVGSGNGQVLAMLKLGRRLHPTLAQTPLHPVLLDAAIQAWIAMDGDGLQGAAVPFACKRLDYYRPCEPVMWAHVRPASAPSTNGLRRLDIDLLGKDGALCAALRDLSLRVMAFEEPATARGAEVEPALIAAGGWRNAPMTGRRAEPMESAVVLAGLAQELSPQALRLPRPQDDDDLAATARHWFSTVHGLLAERLGGKRKQRQQLLVFVPDDLPSVLSSPLAALLRAAAIEQPKFEGAVIRLAGKVTPKRLERLIEAERKRDDLFTELRYDARDDRQAWALSAVELAAAKASLDPDGVYWITGGQGGLGRLFADWLKARGAGHVVLSGRRESADASLPYFSCDVADLASVRETVTRINREIGPLKGVIHAAGLLSDGFILKREAAQEIPVLLPKIDGTRNLDLATQDQPLDFMLLCSSVAGVFGNAGQSGYAAANAFMDALAEQRNEQAAKGQRRGATFSVAWPLWAEGGMSVDHASLEAMRRRFGTRPMPTASGLDALDRILAAGTQTRPVVLFGEAEKLRGMIADFGAKTADKDAQEPVNADKTSLKDAAAQLVRDVLADVLRLEPQEIRANRKLEEYGLDSIAIVEATNRLEESLGPLSKTLFFEYVDLAGVAGHLIEEHAQELAKVFADRAPVAAVAALAAKAQQPSLRKPVAPENERGRHDVAIVGLSLRVSKAEDQDAFWDMLSKGVDGFQPYPDDRWDHAAILHPERDVLGKTVVRTGAFLDRIDAFDPRYFRISQYEAELMSPEVRLFLEASVEAFEDAGYSRETMQTKLGGDVAVIVGAMTNEYDLYGFQNMLLQGSLASGSYTGTIPNMVSYYYGFTGPSYFLDTMCSASSTCVHEAAHMLRAGRCRMALAGGVSLLLHPQKLIATSQEHFTSKTAEVIRGYGLGADGTILGEGVGALVLKRLEDAERDGDHIYGVITGTAVSNAGVRNGFTVPNPRQQAVAIEQALADAEIDANDIGYIEGHGSGTALGDPIEIKALTQVFARQGVPARSCPIGTVKSNVAHLLAASGLAGIAKVLMQMKHGRIAPSLHAETLNPNIPFETSPFFVQRELTVWKRRQGADGREKPRRAGVTSIGAGGMNSHIVIEEYLEAPRPKETPEPQLLVFSAMNEAALSRMLQRFLTHLDRHPDERLCDLAYSLQVGRNELPCRLAVVAQNRRDLIESLTAFAKDGVGRHFVRSVLNVDPMEEGLDEALETADLNALAGAWTSGVDVDWEKLARRDRPRRLSLPAYPFEKIRCWYPQHPEAPSVIHPLASKLKLHPLIGRNLSDLQGIRYATDLHLDDLQDYRCKQGGKAQLPPILALETIAAAARLAGVDGPLVVENAVLQSGFDWSAQRQLEIDVAAQGDDARVRLHVLEEGETRRLWAEAVVSKGSGTPAPARLDQDGRHLDRAQILAALAERGFDFKPYLEVVEEAWIAAGGGVLCRLGENAPQQDQFKRNLRLSAPALAGATQALLLATMEGDGADLSRVERLIFDDRGGVVRQILVKPSARGFDLWFLSDRGETLAMIEGLQTADQRSGDIESQALAAPQEGLGAELRGIAAELLKFPADQIGVNDPFHDLGFDSISLTKLADAISTAYGIQLSPAIFFECETIKALADHLGERKGISPNGKARAQSAKPAQAATAAIAKTTRRPARDAIAIIGMAGRFPGSPDIDAFIDNLLAGRDLTSDLPLDRYGPAYGERIARSAFPKHGGFLDGIDRFDAAFFRVSPAEALRMDPQQRLMLTTAWRALEDAGLRPEDMPADAAVLIGASNLDYAELLRVHGVPYDGYAATGNSLAMIANRVSHFFNWHGPSQTIDTACSSSLTALLRAAEGLRNRRYSAALVGGVNLALSAEGFEGPHLAGMLSPEGRCKSFGAGADGYARGEGVVALLLKRLEDAERDHDRIHGLLIGGAENHGGRSGSLTAPSVKAQAELVEAAMAGIDPESMSYVEAHGTGTALGDPVEANGLMRAYESLMRGKKAEKPFIGLGSVKSNIGHLEAAAGLAGVVKALMAMKRNLLPASLHCVPINPHMELAGSPFELLRENRPWPSGDRPRRAGVSSFGFGGANVHAVFEDYQPPTPHLRQPLTPHPFAETRFWPTQSESAAMIMTPVWKDAPLAVGKPFPARRLVVPCAVDVAPGADCEILKADLSQAPIVQRYAAMAQALLARLQVLVGAKTDERHLIQLVVPQDGEGRLFAGLSGMLETAALESPRIFVQTIEIGARLSPKELAALLAREAQGGLESRLRYRDGARQILTWVEQADNNSAPADLGRIFLITGGMGGLGRLLARHFAATVKGAVLILTGSRPESAECAAFVAELQALGAQAAYRQADVSDAKQAAALVESVVAAHGGLDAALHCAGRLRDGFIARKQGDDLLQVLAPKALGAQALIEACAGLDLKRMILFSSLSGVAGNPGQADYAAANGYLDALAEWKGPPVVAIDWPLWQEGGMRVDPATAQALFNRMGQRPMTTAQGVAALDRILAAKISRASVMAGEPEKIRDFFARLSKPRREAEDAVQTGGDQRLAYRVSQELRRLFESVGGYAPGSIRCDEPLEDYGIDSLMIAKMNAALKDGFVSLPMTLFFEFRTIDQVAAHLADSQPQACRSWIKDEAQAAPEISPQKLTAAAPRPQAKREAPSSDLVAIIGVSGHYPMAEDLDEFWNNLANGRDCVSEIPPDRWDMEGLFDPDRDQAIEQGKSYAKWGGFLEGFADFDPLFFKISPRDAAAMDPQERLFLTAAWEACEDAGYAPQRLTRNAAKVGVFAGVTKTGFALHGPFTTEDGATARPATSFASVANRVSFAFDLSGPSLAVDTMCSSSLVAIHEACRQIREGGVDLALAGGVNLYLHPATYVDLCAARMLSPDGRCRSFGKNANGFVPGEGVGCLLLKPLSKALADKDRVHAVIRASAVNHGGRANGYTVPNPAAQRDLVQEALSQAGLNARQITCIEAHGTGTELGDPIEATALAQAFAADTQDRAFCALGSVKSNIGHLEAAAGVAGLTKLVLQMKRGMLAPTLHADESNPNLHLDATPFFLQREASPWISEGPRVAGVSSFGAGGVNAHVILEEWPQAAFEGLGDDAPQAILLSAKTPEALRRQAERLLAHLKRHDLRLADVAYTLQAGREAMDFRLAFEAASLSALKERLQDWLKGKARQGDVHEGQPGTIGELLALLGGEDELRLMVERWWLEKRFDKILPLWVKGLAIDWRNLPRDGQPSIVSLPAYPFERRRFWLPDSVAAAIAGPRGDAALALGQQRLDAVIAAVLHGLLQEIPADAVLPFYKPWLEAAQRLLATHPKDGGGWGDLRDDAVLAAQATLAKTALDALPEILTGRRQAAAVLFPQGSLALVEAVYKNNETAKRFNKSLAGAALAFVRQSAKSPLRVLEIGAGTGATSEALFAALAPQAGRIGEYCYTDVSQAFLIHAERNYRPRMAQLTTTLFDVEKPPEAQGLALGAYDLVVAANVLHATADMRKTVEHAQRLLAPGGLLLINETSLATLFTHVTFGLLDGWWRFVDPERRIPGTPSLTQESWKTLLTECGFAWLAGSQPTECALGQQIIAAKAPGGLVARPTIAPAAPALPSNGSLRDILLGLLGETLNLPPASIHLDRPFADYGLDSILGAELTHRIRRTLNVEMDQTRLFDFTTAAQLEGYLAGQRPTLDRSAPAQTPTQPTDQSNRREPIAIVGMSGRFAGSPDLDALWKHLAAGDDLVGTTTRFDLTPFYRDAPPGSYGDRGSFIDGVENFDASFFGVSGLEAAYMDPQQRLFLEEAWKTLENAGHAGDDIVGDKVGVFVGCSSGDYQELFKEQPPGQAFWGNTSSLIPSRIAYFLDLKGPAIAIDTACSSSLVAVHMACRSLWNGESRMALAGGVFVQCGPRFFRYANQAKMLSPSGRCAPFGAGADGIVPGEGVAAVLLRPLGDALRDGDAIHGVIVATGLNQDGATNGITAPSAVSQERLIKETQQDFAIDPTSIGLVEAHGTGTILGDPIEHAALARAFGQLPPASCALGSIKSNIGHATTAAGVAGLIKALLCLNQKAIPPTLHFNGGNPAIRFKDSPFFVNTSLVPWRAETGKPRRAAVSSFGFSGTNAHLVVEEPPPAVARAQGGAGPWLFVLSARAEAQLRQLASNMARFLEERPDADAADVAYTLLAGRRHLHRRLAVVAASLPEFASRLRAWLSDAQGHEVATGQLDDLFRAQDGSPAPSDAPLAHLAELYVKGARLDAKALFGSQARRVPLPAYPFAPVRHWVATGAATPAPAPASNAARAVRLADPTRLAASFAAPPSKPLAKLAPLAQAPGASHSQTIDGVCRIAVSGGWSKAFEDDLRQADQNPEARVVVITGQNVLAGAALPECAVPVVSPLSVGNCDFQAKDESEALVLAQRVAQAPRPALIELKKHMRQPNRLPQPGEGALEIPLSNATPPALPDGMPSKPLPLATSCLQASLFEDGVVLVRMIEHRFTDAFMDGIAEAFQMIADLAQAKAVVLTGDGGFFASGGTQEGLESLQRGETRFTDRTIYSLPLDCPLPVVAAMQGHAIGAGWSLGMFCDAALFAAEAVYHSNYLRIGFTPGAGATLIFPHRLGDALGREVLFTAHEYRGRDLLARKPDLRVLPAPQVLPAALALAHGLARETQDRLKALKAQARQPLADRLPETFAQELAMHEKTFIGSAIVKERLEKLFPTQETASPPPPAARPPSGKPVRQIVISSLAEDLMTSPDEIRDGANFLELGLDSILAVTWIRRLNGLLGVELPATAVYAHPSVGDLIAHLEKLTPASVKEDVVAAPAPAVVSSPAKTNANAIAIIGVAGRFPKARDVETFWNNIRQGLDCVEDVPPDRWDVQRFYHPDPAHPDSSYCRWMGAIDEIDRFDAGFFNITPREAELMDPQQRLFLEHAWHAFEDAGLTPDALAASRCGVFMGAGPSGYEKLIDEHNAYSLLGRSGSILAARIAHLLDLRGPCLSLDTACSSSLVAIAQACNSLLIGDSDLALAGGVSVMIGPEMFIDTSKVGMLSKDGRCFAFDQRANGFVPGEGVGILLLKRLEDAERDNDPIHAVIRGWGVNQDGRTNGITAPNPQAQTRLIKSVHERFDVKPASIGLIEAHGTGTPLGDPIEIEGLTDAFAGSGAEPESCALGSVKSNIGHLLAAAGVAGAIKAMLAVERRELPPTIQFENLNEHINLKGTPFVVNARLRDWKTDGAKPRRAGVSAFGFSGTNAHLVIEEHRQQTAKQEAGPWLFTLSARTPERLGEYAGIMERFVAAHPEASLADLAYTLQTGRKAMRSRLAFVFDGRESLLRGLASVVAGRPLPIVHMSGREGALGESRLDRLAQEWVKGGEIDWRSVSQGRRIHLPGYPFARDRHWVEAASKPAAAPPPASAPSQPLLDSLAPPARLSLSLRGDEPHLTSHVSGDERLLLGLFMLELAREAAERASGKPVRGLKHLLWGSPVRINGRARQLSLALDKDDDGFFYQVAADGQSASPCHVGEVGREDAPARAQEPPRSEGQDLTGVYNRFADSLAAHSGAPAPECARVVKVVDCNGGLQARLLRQKADDGMAFDPLVLDAVWRLAAFFHQGRVESGGPLPFPRSMKSAWAIKTSSNKLTVFIGKDAKEKGLAVALFDDKGAMLMNLEDVRLAQSSDLSEIRIEEESMA